MPVGYLIVVREKLTFGQLKLIPHSGGGNVHSEDEKEKKIYIIGVYKYFR